MKIPLALVSILLFSIFSCSGDNQNKLEKKLANENSPILLFFMKSDTSKASKNLKSFSISGEYSHIGVLVKKSNSYLIYQVHPDYISGENFITNVTIDEYLLSEKENLENFSIWELKSLNTEKFISELESISNQKIKFDWNIDLTIDDYLYCSEYIYKILLKTDPIFRLKPKTILTPRLLSYTKKDSLKYIPVDFILQYKGCQLFYDSSN